MRRSDKAVTEQSAIEKILRAGKICQLAFAAEPVPYLVTLNYGYDDDTLYFHSAQEGRKIDLIRENRQVAFTVALDLGLIKGDKACDWSVRFQSVVGHGQISLIEGPEEKQRGLDLFMAHYSDETFSYPDKMIQATAVFKLVISEMTVKQSRVEE
ncbi:MAG: pyridoxamine 5'-phosphate oxidase family protein [Desulfuromusa sp.]|jgi:nitroimidazol reductase NimA-like FMN-containing flavoprotein (pyridoxamine 5'-phosphate oxidase superfamily)|nr:pyridoxamine 5'-phosphate oxidase family protein [Desulfuromusa sp.]